MSKFSDWFNNRSIVIEIKDVVNFFKFRSSMKKHSNDIKFRELGLSRNWLGNIVYTQLNFNDNDLAINGYSPIDMVMNKIKPHIDYLTDLGWGEYLIPEINNFIDDDGNQTLSYLVIFLYTPLKFTLSRLIYRLTIITMFCILLYFGYIYLK